MGQLSSRSIAAVAKVSASQPSRKRTRSSEEVIHRTANTTARTSLHTAITSDSHHSACNGSDHSAQRSTPRLRAYSSEMTATTAAAGNQIGQNGGSRGTRSPWFTAAHLSLVESAHTPTSHKTGSSDLSGEWVRCEMVGGLQNRG